MPVTPIYATAASVFSTARMLLNDSGIKLDGTLNPIQLWSDPVLMPMMYQAHLELQQKLKSRAAPIMRGIATINLIPFQTQLIGNPSDITSPIKLWERPLGSNVLFQPMTEADILPLTAPSGNNLIYWSWWQESLTFVGAALSTSIIVDYWRRLPIPTNSGDLIGVIDGEQYLAPRVAALAMASVGETATSQVAAALAEAQLQIVLSANRSRAPQNIGTSAHP